jgi:succinate dehydrogenase/fumarate reductase cytochrome b subunit
LGKDDTHCATLLVYETGVNRMRFEINLIIKCEYFLRVYLLCYKFGTALRQFLNNLVKILDPVLNPQIVNGESRWVRTIPTVPLCMCMNLW